MSYIVHHENGQKFGPVDLPTINAWIVDGRVGPQTMIEDTDTGVTVPASAIVGIQLSNQQSAPAVEGMAPYYRGGGYPNQPAPAQGELIAAWVLFGASIVTCCPIVAGIGVYFSSKALALGGSTANTAKILNIVMLVISILFWVAYGALIIFAVSMPMMLKGR